MEILSTVAVMPYPSGKLDRNLLGKYTMKCIASEEKQPSLGKTIFVFLKEF